MRSFTTTPNGEMAPIHNRMPVILPPAAWSTWLGEEDAPLEAAAQLLAPYSEHLVMWPVHNDVGLVDPIGLVGDLAGLRLADEINVETV